MSDPLAAIIATLDDHTLEAFHSKVGVAECSCGWMGLPRSLRDDTSPDASALWRTHRATQVLAAIRAEDE